MDEIEQRRAIANLKVLIESVEITEVKHALQIVMHMIISLEQRIDELQGEEDE